MARISERITCPGCGNTQSAYKNNLGTWQMLPHGEATNDICTGNDRRNLGVQETVSAIRDWDAARFGERNGRRILTGGGKRKIIRQPGNRRRKING